ncbi:replication factor C large subunit [Candidatus Woesearchaeota archaeon]|nr:replication factor C large subunit [Candidatus Woesearchaeota archaeon]
MNDLWASKYRPSLSTEIIQPNIKKVKDFISNFGKEKGKKSLLIYGPTGCGKTASVHALANELGQEIVELNASDLRNSGSISSVAGNASLQMSLFKKGKIILIDELDGIAGQEDRGGISELASMIERTRFPVVITANDPFDKKFSQIRSKSLLIEYSPIPHKDICMVLEKVCKAESIMHDEPSLKTLAMRSGGDLRGAINDLEMLSRAIGEISKKDVEELSERDRESPMEKSLLIIFKTTDLRLAITAFDNSGEDLESCLMWVDENLPSEYRHPDEIQNAYRNLSKSDVFLGRIRRSQYWRLLVYANAHITAGVAISKNTRNSQQIKCIRPGRPLKIYISNARMQKLKSIACKVAGKSACSTRKATRNYMPYIKIMFRNRSLAEGISKFLELDEEEKRALIHAFSGRGPS